MYKTAKGLRLALAALGELYLAIIKRNVRFRERNRIVKKIDVILERVLRSEQALLFLTDEEVDLLRRICSVVDSQTAADLVVLLNTAKNGQDPNPSTQTA